MIRYAWADDALSHAPARSENVIYIDVGTTPDPSTDWETVRWRENGIAVSRKFIPLLVTLTCYGPDCADIGEYLRKNKVNINCMDFEKICSRVRAGDFVYFDSPYIPVSSTAYFTDYTADGFTMKDHERLAALFRKLADKGAKVMLSNHNVPLVKELYKGFRIDEVDVKRLINSDVNKRTGKEVIIRSDYE